MEITLEQLFDGKAVKIKSKDYLPTKSYVEPFLERMSKLTNDFRVQVKLPDLITKEDSEEDITYTRVLIQAVLPDNWNNHSSVIGMVYGLDVRKPIIKLYKGQLNMACTNLCVFNPSFLNVQFIEPEKGINYKPIEYLIEKEDDTIATLKTLQDTYWDGNVSNVEANLGKWVRNALQYEYENGYGKIKLGTDNVIKAYNMLFTDKDSPYYIGIDKTVDMFTCYNAFTQTLTDSLNKDILNQCEKTILVRQILGF